jgi:hypothetical protein
MKDDGQCANSAPKSVSPPTVLMQRLETGVNGSADTFAIGTIIGAGNQDPILVFHLEPDFGLESVKHKHDHAIEDGFVRVATFVAPGPEEHGEFHDLDASAAR